MLSDVTESYFLIISVFFLLINVFFYDPEEENHYCCSCFFSVSLFIVIDVVYSLVAVFIESYTFIY